MKIRIRIKKSKFCQSYGIFGGLSDLNQQILCLDNILTLCRFDFDSHSHFDFNFHSYEMSLILQLFLILLGPYIGILLIQYLPNIKWLSPVVWSYALGIIVANFKLFPVNVPVATNIGYAAILFAIPMLLYAIDLIAWFRHARSTVFSFGLCIVTGLLSSTVMAYFFQDCVNETWRLSAMLVGVYTGGTPNLNAIGLALEAQESTIILLNTADSVCGAIYILFLSSFAPTLLGKFLPKFRRDEGAGARSQETGGRSEETGLRGQELGVRSQFEGKASNYTFDLPSFLQAVGLTLLIILASVGIAYLISGSLGNIVWIILALTTFSVLASLSPKVRQIKGTFEMGEYLLLIFCVAIGMLADFSKLAEEGGMILLFTAAVMFSAIFLHYFLAAIFRIDRDTVMITSTAAIMGPVFVGQIASVIHNKQLVFSGMATGLMGYAIGNYLGIGLGYLLKLLL